uniref:Peptidase M41 FtsH extracellular domain-containing protein n=1 Tax=Meloidogyne incognita TaxID=6306 RepID=A0A914LGS0_MELIC
MRGFLFIKCSAFNCSNSILQRRLFSDFILNRRANNNVFSPNYFLQMSKNVNKIQSRGIRGRAKGGFGSSTSSSDNKSSEKENKKDEEEDKYKQFAGDKEKFKNEFLKRFNDFAAEYVKEIAKDPSKAKMMNEATREFIKKFNEKSEGSGFSIEKDASAVKNFFMFNLILAAISAFIMMFILSGEGMDREHLELLNTENKINFDQFVRDYLNVGEVQTIYYYPNRKLAIATLHPNAVINGKTVSSYGVPISTSDRFDFNYSPTQFVHAVRDAEQKLGVDQRENVPIFVKHTMPTGRKIIYFLILGLLSIVSLNYYKGKMGKDAFRVISSAAKKKEK